MRYLVSGGAGFIGSSLVRTLLNEGDEIFILDNLITGKYSNIENIMGEKRVEFKEHDITEPFDPGEIDGIYHLASIGSVYHYQTNPIQTLRVGSLGTESMLKLAQEKGCRIVFTSSSEIYGSPRVHPQKEDYWGYVNPVGIRSVYDESKRYAESLLMAYHRKYNVDIGIARIFNTYGPYMDPEDRRVVPNFITQALNHKPFTIYGDGSQTRSFCYVDDTVGALMKLMESGYCEPVNIGNPYELTIKEFADIIADLIGVPRKYEYKELPENDPLRRKPDISRAKQVLNWEPEIPLKEGLQRTIEWFRKKLQ
ncbi:MAG: UDP-glucuronic acid decarboxylase family protein [candidate division WOR-3 bacterium]|nr:UDP-glucuronic acid decarboxylase family protein [candidate division WOR-3 bacterium]